MTCKTHPDAPHGFVRGASHSEDRYVCECEFWEEPKMNERIKLLAIQADWDDEFREDFDIKKFAELIVRECAKQVDYYWDQFENGYADKKILEHFGVEE